MPVFRKSNSIFKADSCQYLALATLLFSLGFCINTIAAPLGIVSDNGFNMVNVFNADEDVVTSRLAAFPGMAAGDCALSSDEKQGFTSSNNGAITFLDLQPGNGLKISHQKQVAISNLGVDMALSPDDAFLVMAGGGTLQQPLSVVDTKLKIEIATTKLFVDHSSVEFCDNGSMLVTTTHGKVYGQGLDNALYDVSIDATGHIELTGNRLSSGAQPNNAICAPGSFAGVLLDREGGITSFTFPGLVKAEYRSLGTSAGVAAVFSRDGRSLFVRTRYSVQAFAFNPLSGAMSSLWALEMPETSTFYGIEQIAIHPNSNKLYVDGGGPLLILNTETGNKLGDIDLGDTTGICFANNLAPPVDELKGIAGTSPGYSGL